ncbi:efflux RND transporter periplasmic adaptor subunit [Methylotuvimicrobium alcaliphilum]|uniref:Efflux transporter, RND family, MFP subunit n=1 Tax=Methylotuvimicrobium alcaliphilum (strain DSM 19304 / NCIMB 14124 / VKM B-2133 / 20Z) TaxID=1091494 RepID=G4STP0_META2|nr:efflux RND transporter periplasmic adaptor subunit [Methylotuvimicrobium alcaliphilum]CCE21712.1 Efflux transporter, RND family, MFP subunit [Methylotuvimicrobium alcaliphilum 20Z]
MKRIVYLVLAGLISIQAPVAVFAKDGCGEADLNSAIDSGCKLQILSPDTVELSADQIANLGIKLGAMTKVDEIPVLSASARVIVPPDQERIISTAVSGLVSRILVAEGDTVKQGQLLAQLNSPELLALQRDYLKQVSEWHLAEAVYRRDRTLQQEGIIPQSRWEETRSRYQVAKSQAQEAKQLLLSAGMSESELTQLLATRRLNSQLAVSAPIAGIVLERRSVPGERLAASELLFRIADLKQLWLQLAIPQDRVDEIKQGDKVKVDDTGLMAEIVLLGQQVDQQSQSVMVRALIQGPQSELRPGQTVNTQVVKTAGANIFKVPQPAVVNSEGHDFIFIRVESGFKVQTIEVQGRQDGVVYIGGDHLNGSETIALQGAAALKALWLESGSAE